MSKPPTNREFTLVCDIDSHTKGRLTVFIDRFAGDDPEPFFTVYQFRETGAIPIKLGRCDESSVVGRVKAALESWSAWRSDIVIRRPETEWSTLFPEASSR